MKTTKQNIGLLVVGYVLACCLSSFTPKAQAVEGLKVSLQCTNVVLSWPSAESETYIVQYRQTLSVTDAWQTLTSSLSAVAGTNVTTFIHSNIVQNPCNCGEGSFATMPSRPSTLAVTMQ